MTRTVPAAFARRRTVRLGAALTGVLLTAGLIATVQVPAHAATSTPLDPSELISTLNALSDPGTVSYTLPDAYNVVTGDLTLSGQDVVLDLQGGSLAIYGVGLETAAVTISGHTLTVLNGSLYIYGAKGSSSITTAASGSDGQAGLDIEDYGSLRAGALTAVGGDGGDGGPGPVSWGSMAGSGGAGGYGAHVSGILASTDTTISGGTGGNGGDGHQDIENPDAGSNGGNGGNGGTGIDVVAPSSVFLGAGSSITGGDGGNGGGLSEGADAYVYSSNGGAAGSGGASSTGTVAVPGTGGTAGIPGMGQTTEGPKEGAAGSEGAAPPATPDTKFFTTASGESPAEIDAYAPGITAATVSQAAAVLPPGWPTRDGYTLSGWTDSSTGTTDISSHTITEGGTYYTLWATPITPQPPAPRGPFIDVPLNAPFQTDITWLKNQGITGGFADGSFHPTAPITREAVAAFLYRAAHDGKDAAAPTLAPFTDVPVTAPFAGDIAWLKGQGITTGYADGGFHPTAVITREATAAFLYRTDHNGQDAGTASTIFADVPASSPFSGDIGWLQKQGITTGYQGGTYRPKNHITREAVAAFLHRAATN